MNEASRSWSGPFAGQRVPINLNAIIIGFLAVLMLIAGVYVIELFSDEENLIARSTYFFFSCLGDNGVNTFQGIYAILPGSKLAFEKVVQTPSYEAMAILFSWFLFVWAFFGGAINRIIAYHIAKQESMSISAAFKFSWKHKLSLFFTPIMLALVIAFFCCCNYIAGWLTLKFPLIGPILFVALFFLVILSSIFIVVLGIGLIFGFNLISSSICTEGCEGIEGVITSLQYIYSRPWSYMIYHGFVIVSCGFLLWIGGIFVHVTFNTSLVGNSEEISTYIFDENWKTVEVVKRKRMNNTIQEVGKTYYINKDAYNEMYNNLATEIQNEKDEDAKAQLQEQLSNVQMYTASVSDIWAYIQEVPTQSHLWEKTSNEVEPRLREMRLINFWHLDKFWTCIGVFLMIFYYGTQYFVYGYLVAYVFASSTLIYFLMRKEIDATDFDEVWEDDVEDDVDDDVEDEADDDEMEDAEEIEDEIEDEESSAESTPLTSSQKDVPSSGKDAPKTENTTSGKSESKKDGKESTSKDEAKKEDSKPGDKKEDSKLDKDTSKDDAKKDDPKDSAKKDESKKDASKDANGKEESKKDESKLGDKKEDSKLDKKDASKDDAKKDETKDSAKKDEPVKDDSKKDDSKKDTTSKEDSKNDESKKEESKPGDKKEDSKLDNKDASKDDAKKDEAKDSTKKEESAKEESKSGEKDSVKDEPKKDEVKEETKGESKKEEKESTSRKVERKEADSSTMAIPLIKRKPRKTSQKMDKNKFMD